MSSARTSGDLDELLARRLAGFPLEQVVGFAEFCGLRIAVAPGVFVPRRRTEFLVRHAARVTRPGAVVVDMCCGTGAIGVALASLVEPIELYACDIDAAAVRCARSNIGRLGGCAVEGDLYEPVPTHLRYRVDVIVASAPYVPSDAIGLLPPEARLHEPRRALDGGVDGMEVQRRIIREAPAWLAGSGHLLVECSDRQATPLAEEFTRHGLAPTVVASDEHSATVVMGSARP
jgi:release factor glutamine methyltransferase